MPGAGPADFFAAGMECMLVPVPVPEIYGEVILGGVPIPGGSVSGGQGADGAGMAVQTPV